MNNGGVESFVMSYYRELHEYCEFTFLCFDDSKIIPKEEIESLGGHVIIVPYLSHFKAFNSSLRKVLDENKYDIIHSHLNTLSVFPLRIAKKHKEPIRIAHSHSISNKKEWKRHIAKSILRLFSKTYSNVYFSCGEATGRYQFGNKAFNKGKVTIIKNAIKVDNFRFNENIRKEIRDEYNLSENDYLVGTIGRFVETKNQKFILELAKKNKELKYMIVGNGPLEKEYQDYIKENNIDNVIIVATNGDVKKYYSAFDTFILPSFYEGFPITSLEAQSNGLYIIYNTTVPKEGLVTGYGNFISIKDQELWIKELLNKHPRKTELIDVVKEKGYDIKDAAMDLYNKYQELLKEDAHK